MSKPNIIVGLVAQKRRLFILISHINHCRYLQSSIKSPELPKLNNYFRVACSLNQHIQFPHRFRMRRNNLSLFQNRPSFRLFDLFHSQHSQVQRVILRRSDRRQPSLASHRQQKSCLSELKSTHRTNVNTVFSSRLFKKAHRIEQETFLPLESQVRHSNESKIRDVYETYLRRNVGLEKGGDGEQGKKKRLGLSERQTGRVLSPALEANRKLPLISSLTKIIMDQCRVPDCHCSELDCSQWINILCEAEEEPLKPESLKTETLQKKLPQKVAFLASENPYELLSLKRKRSPKENRRPLRDKIQKKRI